MKAKEYIEKFITPYDMDRLPDDEYIEVILEFTQAFYNEFIDIVKAKRTFMNAGSSSRVIDSNINTICVKMMESHKKWNSICSKVDATYKRFQIKENGFIGLVKSKNPALYGEFIRKYPHLKEEVQNEQI